MTEHQRTSASGSGLWKRFSTNFASYGYSQLVTLAVQFVAVPFFLYFWGQKGYAEWLVLSGVPVMLGLMDFGVAHASASRATILASRQEIHGVRVALQTALVFSLFVCAFVMTTGVAAVMALDLPTIFNLESLGHQAASTVLLLLLGHLCLQLLGGPLNGWFIAMDRTSTGFFLLANRRLLDVIVTVGVLMAGGSMVALATAMLVGQALMLLALIAFAVRISPWPLLGIKQASWAEFKTLWKPAAGHVGILVGQVLTLQGGLQILNQIAPASAVVLYSMSRTLMRLVLQIGVVGNHALRPELSRLLGANEPDRAMAFTQRITRLSLMAAVASAVGLVLLGPWFMGWWSTGKVIATPGELALMGLHGIINIAWFVPAALLMAGNQHTRISAVYFIGCVLGMVFWWAGMDRMDPFMLAALALAVPEVFVMAVSRSVMRHEYVHDQTHAELERGQEQRG